MSNISFIATIRFKFINSSIWNIMGVAPATMCRCANMNRKAGISVSMGRYRLNLLKDKLWFICLKNTFQAGGWYEVRPWETAKSRDVEGSTHWRNNIYAKYALTSRPLEGLENHVAIIIISSSSLLVLVQHCGPKEDSGKPDGRRFIQDFTK